MRADGIPELWGKQSRDHSPSFIGIACTPDYRKWADRVLPRATKLSICRATRPQVVELHTKRSWMKENTSRGVTNGLEDFWRAHV